MKLFFQTMCMFFLVLLNSSCANHFKKSEPNPKEKREVASNYLESDEGSYCLSLRGNGQRMGSIWGTMAKSVESFGIPKIVSGGSSSTYSMFLFESVLMNPYIKKDDPRYREKISFLLKTLMGYTDFLLHTKLANRIKSLAKDSEIQNKVNYLQSSLANINKKDGLEKYLAQAKLIFKLIKDKTSRTIALVFKNSDVQMLMNKELFEDFLNTDNLEKAMNVIAISPMGLDAKKRELEKINDRIAFKKKEFDLALKYFGNYNIKENANIFVRPGPMDFLGFANIFNRAANFYAGRGYSLWMKMRFRSFMNKCSVGTINKEWRDIVKEKPYCKSRYDKLVRSHLKRQRNHEKGKKTFKQRIDDQIATELEVIPTTGILLGESAKRIKQMREDYKSTSDANFGFNYKASMEDLRIGYWGKEKTLQRIKNNLENSFYDKSGRVLDFSDDFKSKLFHSLNRASWKNIFMTSPAEPSLTNVRDMPSQSDMVSIGGWMDHLSAPVLKSAGCERVVLMTKGDGEGAFSGGMLKRILGLAYPDWKDLRALARKGDASDETSIWSQFQNVLNPKSSFSTSIKTADAVVCANYDLVEFGKAPLDDFFEDGYNAPIKISSHAKQDVFFSRHSFSKEITTVDRNNINPPYGSCFAVE